MHWGPEGTQPSERSQHCSPAPAPPVVVSVLSALSLKLDETARVPPSSLRRLSRGVDFPQELALSQEVSSLRIIPSYLVQPLKANSSTHLAMSQMDLLARLLRDLGTEGSGFTVDSVMKVSRPLRAGVGERSGEWSGGGVSALVFP